MIHIYTRTNKIFHKEYLKYFLANITGRNRGPRAVVESLVRGLKELNIEFKINPSYSSIKRDDVVYVVTGIQVLKDIIQLKKKEVFSKLLAGPSITVLPTEENGLIQDSAINAVIVPSEWVKKLYESIDNSLSSRIFVLPAGVQVPEKLEKISKDKILIYRKNVPQEILNKVQEILRSKNIGYSILDYGSFKRDDFFTALDECAAMIYLSPTESQGLALHEAWIRDVPTLVWNRGFWQYKDIVWKDAQISAPYLSHETGMFFKDETDFEQQFEVFVKQIENFEPRKHSLENFTDKKCIEKLMWIIDSI